MAITLFCTIATRAALTTIAVTGAFFTWLGAVCANAWLACGRALVCVGAVRGFCSTVRRVGRLLGVGLIACTLFRTTVAIRAAFVASFIAPFSACIATGFTTRL